MFCFSGRTPGLVPEDPRYAPQGARFLPHTTSNSSALAARRRGSGGQEAAARRRGSSVDSVAAARRRGSQADSLASHQSAASSSLRLNSPGLRTGSIGRSGSGGGREARGSRPLRPRSPPTPMFVDELGHTERAETGQDTSDRCVKESGCRPSGSCHSQLSQLSPSCHSQLSSSFNCQQLSAAAAAGTGPRGGKVESAQPEGKIPELKTR